MKKQLIPVLRQLVVVAILLIVPAIAGAQSLNLPLSIMNIQADPAAAGRAGTSIAGFPEANSIGTNPSKAVWLLGRDYDVENKTVFGASYGGMSQGTMLNVSFARVTQKKSDFYGAVRYIRSDSQAIGFVSGSNFRTLLVEGGFVQPFENDRFSFSFGFRYVGSSFTTGVIDHGTRKEDYGQTGAIDISFSYNGREEGSGLAIGAALKNIGPALSFDRGEKAIRLSLPVDIGTGMSYIWQSAENKEIAVLVDIHKSLAPNTPRTEVQHAAYQSMGFGAFHPGSNFTFGAGAQMVRPLGRSARNSIVIRTGYLLDSLETDYSGFTAGAGFRIPVGSGMMQFDVSHGAPNPYMSRLQFSTSYSF